ncbi:ABC transporter permease [Lactobacillus sp. ZJLC29-4]|uniref:ABC transporter permease n=2 Tax=Levilactobacillus tujiorum TaxID=2912243 RepID=A0ABX1L774_9LACO|nr:ABC transporter permease [Lactobacillus sp. HBUAS51387]NLR30159.1 ABC transporter permease [Levilactobacillus tujiorum]
MNMIKGEWNYIRHNRLILISVLAIMFIPFLYSIFFLKSVWDPYGETGSLPVAVVNQDKPVTYQGQKLNVGDQTITNLKKNDQLGWKFVSAKTAADGLKHHKYYTVITIPKNFSANAATALDKHPKKMTFTYKTNGSANYIAQVMSEVGSSKLDSEIRAKVTKAYAQATFKQIYAVGQGMDKAAKGSAKLKDGTVTLTDGLNTYTTGVHTLNNGLQQMKTSVKPLATGIQKLSNGSQTLQSGLAKYTSGVGQYANGVNQYTGGVAKLSAGMPKLLDGTSQLSAGAKTLNTGVYTYVNGVYQLNSGIGTLSNKVGPLASGVTKLANGGKSLTSGLNELDKNSSALKSGASQVNDGVLQLQTMMNQLAPSLSSLTALTKDPKKLQALQTLLDELKNSGALDGEKLAALNAQLDALSKVDLTGLNATLTTAQNTLGADVVDVKTKQAIKNAQSASDSSNSANTSSAGSTDGSAVDAAQGAASTTAQKTSALQEAVKSGDESAIKSAADAVDSAANTAASKTNAIKASSAPVAPTKSTTAEQDYDSAVDKLTADVANLGETMQTMQGSLATLVTLQGQATQLQGLLGSVAKSGLSADDLSAMSDALTNLQAQSGMINQLSSSSDSLAKLVKGTGDLSTGLDTYTAGVSKALAGSNQLSDGLTTMNSQIPTLTAGITQLADGSKKLVKGGHTLKSGSKKLSSKMSVLYGGLETAAGGVNKLNSKTPQLTAAGNKLTSSSAQLMNGSGQLTSGLNELNSKVPTLTSGVNQLADGSQKLDDNSNQLMQGTKKLSDGSGTLAKSLKSGADQIQAQPLTSKTADMFAAPTKLKHENYSYVPNYGHALAPYVLSVALYVGALVFNFAFPIRKVSREGGTATGWYLSKVSIGAVEGLAMGLIEPALMMLGGLSVDHPGQMILISVFFAEASMFIVMFLSMLLDNPGRFIAMVLLMLQLGGSGGTFPMEVTNHFYNVVHPFLPMTYSILGFRQAITSGMSGMVGQALWVLALFTILGLALLWPTMVWLQKKHLMGVSQLDDNQKLQAVEDPNTKAHS